MPEPPPPQLDYAAKAPPWHRHRAARWLVAIVFTAAAAPFLHKLARYSISCLHVDSLFTQSMRYQGPQVGYSEDIIESGRLLRQSNYMGLATGRWPVGYQASVWIELSSAIGPPIITTATVFVHERRTPAGRPVLVTCDVAVVTHGVTESTMATIAARTLTRGSVLSLPQQRFQDNLRLDLAKRDGLLRILWGKIDPSDPSHFTMGYTVAGRVGTIDGWVKDDFSVLLEPRGEPTSQPSASLPTSAAPSTAPAPPSPGSSR